MAPVWIGVVISIAGNIVISLSLNIQKLSHLRLEGHDPRSSDHAKRTKSAASERTHLLVADGGDGREPIRPLVLPSSVSSPPGKDADGRAAETPLAIIVEQPAEGADDNKPEHESNGSRAYLRSPLWWLGMLLLVAGEFGNFASYSIAPASLVAPLGAVALISNCFVSPLLLRERFRWSDLGGIALAILGALTVVFSSKQTEIDYTQDEFLRAISTKAFLAYAIVDIFLLLLFAWLSTRSAGQRFIFVDLGACALAGGLTVLATKGVSTFLRMYLLDAFKLWLFYVLLGVLVVSAVTQINFLNRSLQRFDSREVVPTQFVLFTLSAIIGSAILYREFEDVVLSQALNFFFGTAVIFCGVFLLTRSAHDASTSSEPTLATMPLDQALAPNGPQTTPIRPMAVPSAGSSRGPLSRKASGEAFRSAPRTISVGKILLSTSPGPRRHGPTSETPPGATSGNGRASPSPTR